MLDNIKFETSPVLVNHNRNQDINLNPTPSKFAFNIKRRNFCTSQILKYTDPDKLRQEKLLKPQEAGCFNYTNIDNLGNVSEFYSSDPSLNLFVELNDKLINRLKGYINKLPKNTDLYILPVIRKSSRDGSKVDYNFYSLMFPIKILHNSPMDYYKLSGVLMSKIISKWSKLINLEEGDLELYLMGRPWLKFDESDSKNYFDGVECANALNKLLEQKFMIVLWLTVKLILLRFG